MTRALLMRVPTCTRVVLFGACLALAAPSAASDDAPSEAPGIGSGIATGALLVGLGAIPGVLGGAAGFGAAFVICPYAGCNEDPVLGVTDPVFWGIGAAIGGGLGLCLGALASGATVGAVLRE